MTPPRITCCLDFGAELNPDRQDGTDQKAREQTIAGTQAIVEDFLRDHLRRYFREAYELGPVIQKDFKAGIGSDLLVVNIFLPPHDNMAGIGHGLVGILSGMLVNKFPEYAGKLTVSIGPAKIPATVF